MKYIEILLAKIEALESAKANLQSALLVCEYQVRSFDNVDVYSVFRQSLDTGSFHGMALILNDRVNMVGRQLKGVECLLIKSEEELALLEWSM